MNLPVIFFFVFSFFCLNTNAKTLNFLKDEDSQKTFCVLLGLNPSFIVKLKNHDLQTRNNIHFAKTHLSSLAKMGFTNIRQTSGSAFVISFSSSSFSKYFPQAKNHKKTVCYPRKQVDYWISQIKQNPSVQSVQPNTLMFLSSFKEKLDSSRFLPSELQWNLLTYPAGINIQNAWEITRGTHGIVIAVLDSGYLPHTSLSPNILPGVSFNMGKFNQGAFPSCVPSYHKVKNNPSLCEGYNHGNHVMGIIAASGKTAYGKNIYGVAPNIRVLPINVFSKTEDEEICKMNDASTPCLTAYNEDIRNALNWLGGESFEGLPTAPKKLVGINMSLGGFDFCSWVMQETINRLLKKKVSIIVAAGNENMDAYFSMPANCEGVIPVAATGKYGLRAFAKEKAKTFYYSNYGEVVKIAAPGGDRVEGSQDSSIYSLGHENYYYSVGTSMASPHVAGLVGLINSIDPTLAPNQVLDLIQETASPFPISANSEESCIGKKSCGAGIMNAANALQKTRERAANLVWNRNISIVKTSLTQAKISWQAASWEPNRNMPIVYTVNINGKDIPKCSNIASTTCLLKNLAPERNFSIFVKASDERKIHKEEKTVTEIISKKSIALIPPSLLAARRKLTNSNNVVITYKHPGSFRPGCNYFAKVSHHSAVIRAHRKNSSKNFLLANIPNVRNNQIRIILQCNRQQAVSNAVILIARP